MRMIINTSHLRFGGGVQVALSLINECRKFPDNIYHVFVGPGVNKSLNKDDFPQNFLFYHFNFDVINFLKTLQIQRELSKVEKKINPDIVITTSGPSYWKSRAPQIMGFNLPLYIYPESPYIRDLSRREKLKLYARKAIHYYYFKRDANTFVVQTDDVNRRVRVAMKSNHVYTITNNYNAFYKKPVRVENKLSERTPGEFRLLTLSAWYPHKNLELIPKILEELKRRGLFNIRFVLTLTMEEYHRNIGGNIPEEVYLIGKIKPQECPSLYMECDGMFLPTLAECFSASYPEAMVMNKPIITTDMDFAKSICGDAALYFEPKNEKDAADKILKLYNNIDLRSKLISSGKKELEKFDTAYERAKKFLSIAKIIMQKEDM